MEIGLAQGNFKAHFHMAIIALSALKPYANESLPVLHSINCTTLARISESSKGLTLRKFPTDRKFFFVIDRLRKVQNAY
jgi:hypothetical protein